MASWDTSCVDWSERIMSGRSLVPELPLFETEAARGLRIFKRLRVPDIKGMPTLAEACGPWYFPIVEVIFGSYDPTTDRRVIQEYFELIPKGNAKALALDTMVATPSGFSRVADLEIGSYVIGEDGVPTQVVDKSPVFINHKCYEVEFSTGETVVCDAGHLWVTDAHRDRDNSRVSRHKRVTGSPPPPRPTVKTTEQIANSLYVPSGKFRINNHRTTLCGSLRLPDADLPIPPYALGVWIGDGTSSASAVTAGIDEAEHIVDRLVANGQPAYIRAYKPNGGAATIQLGVRNTVNLTLPYRFRTEAARLNLLNNKHIPPAYLRASEAQRLQLLQGLMDTDGTISPAGQASYTTTTHGLVDDIRELINSLGFKSSVREARAMLYDRDCGPVWSIQFWPFDRLPVFTIPRKLARQKPRVAKTAALSLSRQIVDARPVPSVPVQCISVANTSKQFLITKSLIPTHNSSYGGAVMVAALIVNRRPQAEFLLIAPTKEIADIAFKQASGTIRADAELDKLFHIQRHIRLITHRKTGATLQIKAADTDVITGSKAVGTMIDETHVFAKKPAAADIFVELRGALAKRPDGFLFQTTTQSKAPPAGVFRTELMTARKVRDGVLRLPLLPVIYELPAEVAADDGWKERRYWPLVNPNLGRSVNETFLVDELRKAEEQGLEQLVLLASQHFNVEIGISLGSDRWRGADHWLTSTDPTLTLETLLDRSEVVTIGVDGGGLDDLLSISVLGREIETRRWLAWSKSWVHRNVLQIRKSEAARLNDFAASGDLVIVDDMEDAFEQIADLAAVVDQAGLLSKVGLDPMGVGMIVDALAAREIDGDRVVAVSQGWTLNGAIKTTEVKLASGAMVHADQAIMNWAVGNAKAEPKGNAITINKQTSGTGKIDPVMALCDAVALMSRNPEAQGASIYENPEAYAAVYGAEPKAPEAWDPEVLKNVRHPLFDEHKRRFEAWQDTRVDEEVW